GFPVVIVSPEGLDVHQHRAILGGCERRTLDARWFRDRSSYNELMFSQAIYSLFADHEFILIHQSDAFVFVDQFTTWCATDIDYIGAPFWSQYGHRKDI